VIRRLFLLLVVLSVACGNGPPAKAPDPSANLAVGKGDDSKPVPAAGPTVSPENDLAVPIGESDPVRGNRGALVTLVVFSDFQCPFCSRLATTLAQLSETNGPDDLRIVFKNLPLPFHPHARFAAEVGAAVHRSGGNDAFWRYHDIAFDRQRLIDHDEILRWAAEAGGAGGEPTPDAVRKVEEDLALSERLGVHGTPMSFVNGTPLSGAQPLDKFAEVIEREKLAALALVEKGVPREKIYASQIAVNYKSEKEQDDADEAARKAKEAADAAIVHKVSVSGAPVRGRADALVTIVEFSDFQCPYCKRVEPTLDQVRKQYGDKVRIVWKDEPLPFHPRAEPAAELARAARAQKGDAGFWAMHDALFDSQPALEDSDFERIAKKVGLDAQKALAQVKAKTYARGIGADKDQADDVSASGTPHFFVNGRRLVGAQPFEKFKALIDDELVRAEKIVKGGVARASVYEALIKDGKGPAEPEKKSIAAAATASPWRGAKDAKIVVTEVGDFQDPFSGRVETTVEDLMKEYPGKIKIVWRDYPLPFHADAALAAEAVREAFAQKGSEGFTKMQALLMSNQGALKRSDLDGYAQQIGLDTAKFAKALDEHTHKAAVDADTKAAKDAGVSGTPAFFIGPYFVSGAQPLAKFRRIVDRVQSEAKK